MKISICLERSLISDNYIKHLFERVINTKMSLFSMTSGLVMSGRELNRHR